MRGNILITPKFAFAHVTLHADQKSSKGTTPHRRTTTAFHAILTENTQKAACHWSRYFKTLEDIY